MWWQNHLTAHIYDTSQITSIVEEYVNYGRINSLEKYARSLFTECNEEVKGDVELILLNLAKLAEDIQLCRTKMMLEDFYQEGGVGQKIDDFLDQNKDSDNASIEIFNHILVYIKAEFNEGIYRGTDIDGENILYLPKVIKWCLEKDFVQQALTLCSERIPGYLFESKKIELSDELGELLESVNTNKYEKSYYFIANMRHEFLSKMDNAKVQASLNAIKNMDRTRRILSEENWKKIELDTPLPCKGDTRFGVIAEKDKIYQMALSYKNMEEGDIDEENIRRIVISNGFNESILKKEISISKSNTAEILNVFQGKYIDKNGNAAEHPNLKTKEDRLIKILPALIRLFMPTFQGMEEYKQLIDEVFKGESNSFKEALKNKYAKVQSDKYYVREAMLPTFDHIFTNLPGGADDLQRILYLYSMCKEQRNFSNHAHVSDNDRPVAMNARQLKCLINSLLNACEAT